MPAPACFIRLVPSNSNGLVTTSSVGMHIYLATRATMGDAPVPASVDGGCLTEHERKPSMSHPLSAAHAAISFIERTLIGGDWRKFANVEQPLAADADVDPVGARRSRLSGPTLRLAAVAQRLNRNGRTFATRRANSLALC